MTTLNTRLLIFIASLALLPASLAAAPDAPSPADAEAVFARFQALAGTWTGKSTKGWETQVTMKPIAAKSAVVSTSFDAHPDETMLTVYHLDGDRLMLTHYCAAKNQPRMVLTSWDPKTGEAVFEFLDATGIDSRDQGHMDQAVFRFDDEDPDRLSSRWSWYQDGAQQWFEEITYTRGE